MSEVKRLQRYSRDFNGNLSKDPNGDWILFGDAAEREGILTGKIGAQRLRADTAEAERDALRTSKEAVEFNLNKVDRALLAAEQRIAELQSALIERDLLLVDLSKYAPSGICAPTALQGFAITARRVLASGRVSLTGTLTAALNPNPEAESHE